MTSTGRSGPAAAAGSGAVCRLGPRRGGSSQPPPARVLSFLLATPLHPLLKHLLQGEGGCSRMTELSRTALGLHRLLVRARLAVPDPQAARSEPLALSLALSLSFHCSTHWSFRCLSRVLSLVLSPPRLSPPVTALSPPFHRPSAARLRPPPFPCLPRPSHPEPLPAGNQGLDGPGPAALLRHPRAARPRALRPLPDRAGAQTPRVSSRLRRGRTRVSSRVQ